MSVVPFDSTSFTVSSRKRGNSGGDTTEAQGPETKRSRDAVADSGLQEQVYSGDFWIRAVRAELTCYTRQEDNQQPYKPGPLTKEQLRKAAEEYKRRNDSEDNEDVPWVLVSQDCDDIPAREFEMDALQSTQVLKLWYVLTEAKDLLIVKAASDDAHGKAVTLLVRDVGRFADQYLSGTTDVFDVDSDGKCVVIGSRVAPDVVLQRAFPSQPVPPPLRAPLVIELEVGNRGPKALMEQLSSYLAQPDADYVLGIKIYGRVGPPVPAPGKRPFAAIALLWRRGAAPVGASAQLVRVWSFGTCALAKLSVAAFCQARGTLQRVRKNQIVHPLGSSIITIPAAHLLRGAVDENGIAVQVLNNGNDLEIDLGRIRNVCDRRLKD
jgi:hypothetical protein